MNSKTSDESVQCTEASNPERMYQFPGRKLKKDVFKNMHLDASDESIKMMMDLIGSANDVCFVFEICDYLGNITEIDHERQINTASVVLTPRRILETLNLLRQFAAEQNSRVRFHNRRERLSKNIVF